MYLKKLRKLLKRDFQKFELDQNIKLMDLSNQFHESFTKIGEKMFIFEENENNNSFFIFHGLKKFVQEINEVEKSQKEKILEVLDLVQNKYFFSLVMDGMNLDYCSFIFLFSQYFQHEFNQPVQSIEAPLIKVLIILYK